ncbi:MAG: tRNA-dihydrouridine synthase family protein [Oscillibacter sp.]|nr:tRNA-dihydrouridine synthase family protein [Oscillibacter sp.]
MIARFDLAPLDGITKRVFRRVWHARFGGADRYFIPFLSPTDQHILTPRDRREVENPEGLPQVPQIMAKRAEDFVWAAETLADMGYGEVNLNLGCPSGTVTAKGKGSGLLADPDRLDRFLDGVFSHAPVPVSVKTRLGYQTPEEFPRLLEIFNRYPIACLTIHPRVRPEKYRGQVHLDSFALAMAESKNPVCYNGDLVSVPGVRALEARFPNLGAAMIGRGAIADPALFRRLRGGPAATREELRTFTEELYQAYQDFYGQAAPASQRMKEIWFYLIHLFEGGERLGGRMRRSRGPRAYEELEAQIFQELALLDEPLGELV